MNNYILQIKELLSTEEGQAMLKLYLVFWDDVNKARNAFVQKITRYRKPENINYVMNKVWPEKNA